MKAISIHERVRVLAAFTEGRLSPVRFKWNHRTYAVEQVNGDWVDHRDEGDVRHFSVQVEGGTYFLHFSTSDMQWWLDELVPEDGSRAPDCRPARRNDHG